MFWVHDKDALLLTRRQFEHRARNRMQRIEPDIYKTLIKRLIFDDSVEIEIRLKVVKKLLKNHLP